MLRWPRAAAALQNVKAVGATDASCHEAAFHGIPLLSLEQALKVGHLAVGLVQPACLQAAVAALLLTE